MANTEKGVKPKVISTKNDNGANYTSNSYMAAIQLFGKGFGTVSRESAHPETRYLR
jgi:hypothetical protein